MLQLTFYIRRKKFYYVVSIYIPTILITILSWVSFWIPRNSPPARVGLGITTVLALTTLIFGIQSSMPKVSYVKAIDWFLCVSFLYVFAALVEYPSSTFVKSQAQKLSRKGTNILRKVKGLKEDPEDIPLSGTRYGSTDKVDESLHNAFRQCWLAKEPWYTTRYTIGKTLGLFGSFSLKLLFHSSLLETR